MIKRLAIFRWITALWRRYRRPDEVVPTADVPPVDEAPAPQPESAPELPPPAQPRRTGKARVQTDELIWTFRHGVLERLDEYFDSMNLVRKYCPDDYDYFARVGVPFVPGNFKTAERLPSNEVRVDCGGVCLTNVRGEGEEEDPAFDLFPSFIFFRKMAHPSPTVRQHFGDVYRVVIVWDDRDYKRGQMAKFALPCQMYMGANPDGTLTVLPELAPTTQKIISRAHAGGPKAHYITRVAWKKPEWIMQAYSQKDRGEMTPDEWATTLLMMAYETYRTCQSKILISAQRARARAMFGIPLDRAPYFFRDRDLTAAATPNGKRKPIFHHVREHNRETPNKVVTVKSHYRGLRTFFWGDCKITITWPGRQQEVLLSQMPESYDHDSPEVGDQKMVGSRKVGAAVSDLLLEYDERGR